MPMSSSDPWCWAVIGPAEVGITRAVVSDARLSDFGGSRVAVHPNSSAVMRGYICLFHFPRSEACRFPSCLERWVSGSFSAPIPLLTNGECLSAEHLWTSAAGRGSGRGTVVRVSGEKRRREPHLDGPEGNADSRWTPFGRNPRILRLATARPMGGRTSSSLGARIAWRLPSMADADWVREADVAGKRRP